MLTKEHLKYRVRAGRLHPAFIEPIDAAARATAAAMVDVFASAAGSTVDELEELASEAAGPGVGAAFAKLLMDRCEVGPDDPSVEDLRWQVFAAAARMRRGSGRYVAPSVFRERVAAEVDVDAQGLPERLYSDLPGCRKVRQVPALSAESLVTRYNVAQVQGLLLQSKSLTITIGKDVSQAEKRALFRQIRFHRLLCQVVPGDAEAGESVTLSGPLDLFDQASVYGLRLANFFPHVVRLGSWKLEATVHLKKRDLVLKLDQKAGLQVEGPTRGVYVPEELTALIDGFNKQHEGRWRMAPADEFVHLGRESYCFPDLTITSYDGKQRRHVELFHCWHKAQLAMRLETLETVVECGLIIGVAKAVAAAPELKERLAKSATFARRGFLFAEFPTPRQLASHL